MQQVLDGLLEKHDIVIVDGPPIMGLADAVLLARSVEAVLVVVEANRTLSERSRRRHFTASAEQYHRRRDHQVRLRSRPGFATAGTIITPTGCQADRHGAVWQIPELVRIGGLVHREPVGATRVTSPAVRSGEASPSMTFAALLAATVALNAFKIGGFPIRGLVAAGVLAPVDHFLLR